VGVLVQNPCFTTKGFLLEVVC